MSKSFFWSSAPTPDDVIIHIQSLKDLVKHGWKITVNNTTKM
ncbi:unnamed protein product, partial [Rotaria socialis]